MTPNLRHIRYTLRILGTIISLSVIALSAHGEKTTPFSYQKPGAPIRLGDPISLALPVNTATTETLRFSASQRGTLTIQAKPGPNISINDGSEHTFDLSEEAPELTLTITTQEDSMSHIMFHAVISYKGTTRSRVFGIPVRVGDPVIQTKANSHQPFVIMKAEETIQPKKKP